MRFWLCNSVLKCQKTKIINSITHSNFKNR
jgi:hypothetical protein